MARTDESHRPNRLGAEAALRYVIDGQLLLLIGVVLFGQWLRGVGFSIPSPPLHQAILYAYDLADAVFSFVGSVIVLAATVAILYKIVVDATRAGRTA